MNYVFLDPSCVADSPEFKFITGFLKETRRTQIGWHYVVDLAWIYSRVRHWPKSYRILDAGGGLGPTQFLLAELGFHVTNLDLVLPKPKERYRRRYRMRFTAADSHETAEYADHLSAQPGPAGLRQRLRKKVAGAVGSSSAYQLADTLRYRWIHDQWQRSSGRRGSIGRLDWMEANLCSVPEIATDSFDAVVSLSALEHIPLASLPQAWAEITRICRPEAKVAVTTSATERDTTWFHEPSKGLCLSQQELATIFGASPDPAGPAAEEMLAKYQANRYLKDHLAGFYFQSGDNGMPWGRWQPAYFPVGLYR